jgi:NitT/TauT family transport system permease protein
VTVVERAPAVAPAAAPTTPAVPTGPTRRRRALRTITPPLIFFVVFIAGWEGVSKSLSPGRSFLVPTPLSVLEHGILSSDAYDQILPSFVRTALLALCGLLVAMVIGMAVAAILYRFRALERASYPYLVAVQAVPILAIAPLMAVAFGYSEFSKGIIVVLIAFFPISTNFLLGLKSVDQGLDDLFRLHHSGWLTRFWKLALPNSLPQLLTGFRISAGLAVIGAIVGEEFFQSGSPGLGMRLLQYLDDVEYNQLYGCIILSSLLGIGFYLIFNWITQRALRSWHESVQNGR